MELRRELIELEPMMREVIAGQEIDVAKKKLVLTKNIQAGIGTMWGDKDKLTEVLINLLSNAVKYTPAGGKISVVLSGTKDAVRLEVADTGKGIAGEDLTKIFDKFERVTAEKEEGTGLGLAITKDIVELHKGKVWAESEPGKGSSFIVTLPRDLRQKAIE
jgi:signal transduction histidine kinase